MRQQIGQLLQDRAIVRPGARIALRQRRETGRQVGGYGTRARQRDTGCWHRHGGAFDQRRPEIAGTEVTRCRIRRAHAPDQCCPCIEELAIERVRGETIERLHRLAGGINSGSGRSEAGRECRGGGRGRGIRRQGRRSKRGLIGVGSDPGSGAGRYRQRGKHEGDRLRPADAAARQQHVYTHVVGSHNNPNTLPIGAPQAKATDPTGQIRPVVA